MSVPDLRIFIIFFFQRTRSFQRNYIAITDLERVVYHRMRTLFIFDIINCDSVPETINCRLKLSKHNPKDLWIAQNGKTLSRSADACYDIVHIRCFFPARMITLRWPAQTLPNGINLCPSGCELRFRKKIIENFIFFVEKFHFENFDLWKNEKFRGKSKF